jgi:hypothetical protein
MNTLIPLSLNSSARVPGEEAMSSDHPRAFGSSDGVKMERSASDLRMRSWVDPSVVRWVMGKRYRSNYRCIWNVEANSVRTGVRRINFL